MPIYEYQCTACGETVEAIQKTSDPPLADCPSCDGGKLRKLLSAPAFQFKGSGWYVTDYAGRKEPTKSKDGDKGGDKESSGESSGDSSSSTAEGSEGKSGKSEAATPTSD